MSNLKNSDGDGGESARLKLKAPRRIVLRKTVEGGSIKQNFSHGRSKSVVVEVRKKKTFIKSAADESETLGISTEMRKAGTVGPGGTRTDEQTTGLSQQADALSLAGAKGVRERKQHILAPMTAAEKITFQETKAQDLLAAEQAKLEQERQERLEAERLELQRLENERLEVARLEAERLSALKAQQEVAEQLATQAQTPLAIALTTAQANKQPVTAIKEVETAAEVKASVTPEVALPIIQTVEAKPEPKPDQEQGVTPPVNHTVSKKAAEVAKPAFSKPSAPKPAGIKPIIQREETPKNLTRAQREELARSKTEILVAKRLTQLNELREQKRKIDERRSIENSGKEVSPRETLKSKVKRKGKKATVATPQEKQLPVRKGGPKLTARRGGRYEVPTQPVCREVIIPEVITVGELANRMAIKSSEVIKRLMAQGMMVTINQVLDQDTAVLVVEELGHRPKTISEGAAIEAELADSNDLDQDLTVRSPVVTIMGHVDHGKTSLLDAIRKTDVAAREFGGITQHIGAYQVLLENNESITFLDTPGHSAFTAMRARGAKVTDIVVLVVAADDGVMPQTLEAMNHAKAAGVPIVVAINKIDRANANPDRVMQQLSDHGLVPEAWGGDSIFLNVSAKSGEGIETLKEMILLQAEILNLRANFGKKARGYIIEAKLDKGRGAVATCLVVNGVLRVGDIFVVGSEWGKIRGLLNDKGMPVLEATPAMPVEVIGLSGVPAAGDDLITVPDERRAREIAAFRMRKNKEQELAKQSPAKLDELFDQIKQGEMEEVKVVIKADVQGSLEAVADALLKITHEKIRVNIIHTAVGGITESDLMLAVASHALVIGFNVRADAKARELAKREQADMRFYTVIYDLVDDVTSAMEGKLSPILKEVQTGRAEIRELFRISKIGLVAGCMILDGTIQKNHFIRLLRDDVVLHVGTLHALKRYKDDVKEVREGVECGISLHKFTDLRVGDQLEAFTREEVKATINN